MDERDVDPSEKQTADEITTYYRSAPIGAPACIRTTYGGTLEFQMSSIVREARKSRIVLADMAWNGGNGWLVDGRNSRAPGGKAKLVIPTLEIKEWIKAHPFGSTKWGQGSTSPALATLDEKVRHKYGLATRLQ